MFNRYNKKITKIINLKALKGKVFLYFFIYYFIMIPLLKKYISKGFVFTLPLSLFDKGNQFFIQKYLIGQ